MEHFSQPLPGKGNIFTRVPKLYALFFPPLQTPKAEAAEVLRINPKFFLEYFSKTVPFKDQADTEHLINALRKAGLK